MHHRLALSPLADQPIEKAGACGHVVRSRIMAGIVALALCSYSIAGCVVASHGKMPQVNLQTLAGLASSVTAGFIDTDDGPV